MTTNELCQKVIAKQKQDGSLDVESMTAKLDVFLLNNRISQDQYNELVALMSQLGSNA
jgi:hypothetical protein